MSDSKANLSESVEKLWGRVMKIEERIFDANYSSRITRTEHRLDVLEKQYIYIKEARSEKDVAERERVSHDDLFGKPWPTAKDVAGRVEQPSDKAEAELAAPLNCCDAFELRADKAEAERFAAEQKVSELEKKIKALEKKIKEVKLWEQRWSQFTVSTSGSLKAMWHAFYESLDEEKPK